jgi:4-hydroxy-3-polyprenylbenzoate decarboxylase
LAYNDLREWIAALDRAGELKKIRTEADPILEIAEVADRVSKSSPAKYGPGGPALLFQNVKGHPGAQLLINQFGSERRMRLALEVDALDEIADRIRAFMDVKSPQGFLDKVKMLPMLAEMGKFFPRSVTTGSCKEIILREKFSLLEFPILQCWPKDAGRFITLPCVITRDPRTGKRNVGMYRMQVYNERTTGMHWQRQKVAAEHYRDALRAAARASGAAGIGCAGRRRHHGAVVWALAGGGRPFGEDGSGRRSGQIRAHVFGHRAGSPGCRGIHHRRFPGETWNLSARPLTWKFLPTRKSCSKVTSILTNSALRGRSAAHRLLLARGSVSCFPRHVRDSSQGPDLCHDHRGRHHGRRLDGQGRAHLPAMRLTIPEIVDVNLPVEGVFHNLMIVSIKKSYPGQARKVMSAIWGLGQAMSTKVILVVDEDVNVQDIGEVTLKVLNNIDPERDIQFTLGPVDSLDHVAAADTDRRWAWMPREVDEGSPGPGPTRLRWITRQRLC